MSLNITKKKQLSVKQMNQTYAMLKKALRELFRDTQSAIGQR